MKNLDNPRVIVFDLDDTLFDSSRDDRGDGELNIKPFDGVVDLLNGLHDKKILVTRGDEAYQNKKIDLLGIRPFFDKIYICPTDTDKLNIFKTITEEYPGKKIVTIGNRIDCEIRYGKMLGHDTIYLKHGKYSGLVPQDTYEIPDYTIEAFNQTQNILSTL